MIDQFDRLRRRNAFVEQYKKEKIFENGLEEFDDARYVAPFHPDPPLRTPLLVRLSHPIAPDGPIAIGTSAFPLTPIRRSPHVPIDPPARYSRTSRPSTARQPKSCSKSTKRARARTTSHTCVPSHPHPTCPLLTSRRPAPCSRRSVHLHLERTRTGRWRARRGGVTALQVHGIRCELLRGAT